MRGHKGLVLLCMLAALCVRSAALRTLPRAPGALRTVSGRMGALHSTITTSTWFPAAASPAAPGPGRGVTRMSGGSAAAVTEAEGGGEVKTTTAEERADAEALKQGVARSSSGEGSCESSALEDFESVDISPSGTFKYVLILAEDTQGNTKHLVRGYRDSEYHVYAARPTVEKLRDMGMSAKVLGGGRLKHAPEKGTLHLWGKSHSFGREDKSITQEVCQLYYPQYKVTWENGGY